MPVLTAARAEPADPPGAGVGPEGPTTPGPTHRIPFPAPRFPAGVASPVAVLVVGLLVVAAVAGVVVRTPGARTVPAPVLDADRAAATSTAAGLAARLGPAGGLAAATRVRSSQLPSPPGGPRLALVGTDGRVLATSADERSGGKGAEAALLDRAAAASTTADHGDLADASALTDPDRDPAAPVAAASFARVPLPGAPGALVVAVTDAPPAVTPDGHPGIVLGAVLAGLAALSGLVLRAVLVRPLRRLRDDSARLTDRGPDDDPADEPDDPAAAPVRRSRVREVAALGAALDPRSTPAHHRTISAPLVAGLLAVALLGTLATGVLTLGRGPQHVAQTDRVGVTGAVVAGAGDALRRRLDDGDARVRDAADPQLGDPGGGDLAARADALATVPGLFRSVAVVGRDGATRYSAGARPLRTTEPVPAAGGIHQLNTTGTLPIVVASAWSPDGALALVGEYDVGALADGLREPDTHLVVADGGGRTVLDSDGFQAFTPLDGPSDDARRRAPTAGLTGPGGGASSVVSVPVGDRDAAAVPGWVLVGTQHVEAVAFRQDTQTRGALVVAGLGGAVTVGTLAWLGLVVLAPLRRATRPGNDPGPRPVERLDEVGAVVARLNARNGGTR